MSATGSTFMHRKVYRTAFLSIGYCMQLYARRDGVCSVTDTPFKAGTLIGYNRKTGQVTPWPTDDNAKATGGLA